MSLYMENILSTTVSTQKSVSHDPVRCIYIQLIPGRLPVHCICIGQPDEIIQICLFSFNTVGQSVERDMGNI